MWLQWTHTSRLSALLIPRHATIVNHSIFSLVSDIWYVGSWNKLFAYSSVALDHYVHSAVLILFVNQIASPMEEELVMIYMNLLIVLAISNDTKASKQKDTRNQDDEKIKTSYIIILLVCEGHVHVLVILIKNRSNINT